MVADGELPQEQLQQQQHQWQQQQRLAKVSHQGAQCVTALIICTSSS
jgi:hypothetical protein